jgi:hypothetical protein
LINSGNKKNNEKLTTEIPIEIKKLHLFSFFADEAIPFSLYSTFGANDISIIPKKIITKKVIPKLISVAGWCNQF